MRMGLDQVVFCSRHAVGESPVAAAKARERYWSEENPDRVVTSLTGMDVVERSRFASSIRASMIFFWTGDEVFSLKTLSTRVREKPT